MWGNNVPAVKGVGHDLQSLQAMKGSLTPTPMSQSDLAQMLVWSNPPLSSRSLPRFQPWLVWNSGSLVGTILHPLQGTLSNVQRHF